MNLPNKLTLLRIILVPVFIAVAAIGFPGWNYVAAVVFLSLIHISLTPPHRQKSPDIY